MSSNNNSVIVPNNYYPSTSVLGIEKMMSHVKFTV